MTNTNVSATKPTVKIVHESPSLLRVWWMNKNLQYNIAMNSFIIILNIAAILYMKTHKILVNGGLITAFLPVFVISYFICGLASCIFWILGITDEPYCEIAYVFGRICHNAGLVIFLEHLYCISPHLALLIGIFFGLPCLLWLIADMTRPPLCEGMQELRDWWEFVNQPQSVVTV